MLLHRREDAELALNVPVVVVTDIILDHMTDEEAVTAFIRTNRTAAQRFFDALRSIIQTIKEALGGERTLAQAERFWKRAFEKAEESSRAEALSRGEVSSRTGLTL